MSPIACVRVCPKNHRRKQGKYGAYESNKQEDYQPAVIAKGAHTRETSKRSSEGGVAFVCRVSCLKRRSSSNRGVDKEENAEKIRAVAQGGSLQKAARLDRRDHG